MKKVLTTASFLLGLVTIISLNAQLANFNDETSKTNLSKDTNKLHFLVKESFPLKTKGEIFLFEDWKEGIITDFQDERFKIPLRYRIANEEIQVEHNNKIKALQVPPIKIVEVNNRIFIASKFVMNEENFMSFFEVISDGKIQLLKKYEAIEKKGMYSTISILYSKKGNNPAEKVSFKKKDILNLSLIHISEPTRPY